ncbi:hypothetical protein SynA1825c_01445 [Synechococcus sp. A18-25c]|nr:hypothetical protein SynA1825c_01445 [Synechococcus sp. A18-25c]
MSYSQVLATDGSGVFQYNKPAKCRRWGHGLEDVLMGLVKLMKQSSLPSVALGLMNANSNDTHY